ncbi:serine/threonine-protein kinase [Prosthecobacter fusiformis]|uniref:serine/threonine-protein kinase n=1 Tax=Prosthecobacter fusiformis TaxID=48464 RepID=UPI001AAF157F|nr:serine/threonine-protein kinase [Prosthecobacter fusiformis]
MPSFQSIVEMDLGGPLRPAVEWQGTEMIPKEVLMLLLPQYEGWEFLGAGGMGVVYKAWHRELHRWAAVKFLAPRQCRDSRALARFQNEASLLAQLRHPNIVPVHDFGSEGDVAWLVMDFVDGVPLVQWTEEKSRKPTEMAQMVAKIARAVGVAHASGITHRDLKPGNILVIGEEPVLLDFGLAQNMAWQQDIRLTQKGELAGTVAYLAPEQVQPSLGEPAPATDVHACGVMLYEMLARKLPRSGLASEIIARLHEDDQPPRLRAAVPSVRKELDAICWRAMQKSPEDRYANGISLAEDLERFCDGRPVRAKNPDLLDLAYLYVRRNPWAMVAGGVAVMALVMFAWSASRLHWSQEKAALLSQINRHLSESDWTPERLMAAEELLKKMRGLDGVLEKYLEEDVQKRTHSTVVSQLEAPRLSEEQSAQVGKLLQSLVAKKHPESAALLKRWHAREAAWQTVASLSSPISQEAGEVIFRPGTWEARKGGLCAVPTVAEQTWNSLISVVELNGSVELEVEFGAVWQEAKALGVVLKIPLLKDIRFQVFQWDRFAQHQPDYENPEKAPVIAILADKTALVYAKLPRDVRKSGQLVLRCRYENGDLTLSANGMEPLHYTRIFELARPLADTYFSVLLPVESSLVRLELRQREASSPASPLTKADDLVSIGKAQEAMAIYEKYLNRADVKTECLYKYAACLEALQKTGEATQRWEQVARSDDEPWCSLAMFQLWRSHLAQGEMERADAWFDLLMASNPPEIVRTGIPTGDRLMLNQHYLPVTRSMNCLKVQPDDLSELDRAVRVQQFLGADDRQLAARTAMAFHFAGQNERARQLYRQAVTRVRPSPSLPGDEAHMTLLCLDQWAALGGADGDAVLQATVTSWQHALKGSALPARAIPCLEDLRHELRQEPGFKRVHREAIQDLTEDPKVMLRHRVEAWLIAGLGEKSEAAKRQAWKKAVEVLAGREGQPDHTQQRLHSEFVARSLDQSWTAQQATEWMTTLFGKARPLVSQEKWVGPLVQALVGHSLAKTLNQTLQDERGQRFAHDYILRTRPARDLAYEGMELVWVTLFSDGTGWPTDHPQVQESAAQIVRAFCAREITEIALMQFFSLWNGVKNQATWEIMSEKWSPELRDPVAALLHRRYGVLGQADVAAEFLPGAGAKEKPAPETTRVSP